MPTIYLEKENKTLTTKTLQVKDILKELNINPTTIIITRNKELITDDTQLSSGDKIEILPVISGG
jgi:thiamine biosynthesis protein ThiS